MIQQFENQANAMGNLIANEAENPFENGTATDNPLENGILSPLIDNGIENPLENGTISNNLEENDPPDVLNGKEGGTFLLRRNTLISLI